MPFAKWNLEPVFVSRGQAWCGGGGGPGKLATVAKLPPPLRAIPPDKCSEVDGNVETPKATLEAVQFDQLTTGHSSDEILLKIHCRTMVSVIRQMAALLTASDQLFSELTDECRRLMDRTSSLQSRVAKINRHVDRLNISMRQKPPRIASIIEVREAMSTTGGRSAQWKFPIVLERSLFSAETRPLAIRNLYARANAPGDVRLSCQYSFSRGSNRQPVVTKSTNVNEQCQCVCGRCHQEASSSSSASHHHHEKSNENGQTESEYGTSRSCDCCRRESTNSSSSSVVTWSSITSSTFDPPHSHLLHLVKAEQQHKTVCQQQQQQRPKHTEALSSFSSGEYFTEPKTIDDFFRKNNVESQKAAPSIANTVTTVCTCSCSKEASGSQHFESSSELGSVIQQTNASQVKCSDAKVEDQVDGWSRCHWWPGGADDEHRRWSTAFGSSPLKPVKLDETSVWLRENIETRRPESLVVKSFADLPTDVLLEHALSPPCSSHSIQLNGGVETQPHTPPAQKGSPFTRLKRRWSLFPIRRSKRNFLAPTELSRQNRISLPPESRVSSQQLEVDSPTEVVLISPEERSKLLADQYCSSTVVPIDVSGRSFNRLSKTRRSLIHSEFHIPRHRVTNTTGQRSKSPNLVSPYALSQVNLDVKKQNRSLNNTTVEERGCQTEDLLEKNGQCRVEVEVHNNSINDHDGEDQYVLIMKKPVERTKVESDNQKNVLMRNRTFERKVKSPIGGGQNGARSSSGNWSATTSELVQSSSTSSSPLHMPHNVLRHRQQPQQPVSPPGTKNAEQQTMTNEEAESVYSVDNDGYYTSMHTDSGLYFGSIASFPRTATTSATASKQSTSSLSFKKRPLEKKHRRMFAVDVKGMSINRWKRFEESVETVVAAKQPVVNGSLMATDDGKQSHLYGSNLSINSILSNSDAATSGTTALDNTSSMADFDCSVSHCSHQHSSGAKLRTASGTYDDDDEETLRSSSSLETLNTDDLNVKRKQKLLRNKSEQVKTVQATSKPAFHRSLTESSSNSSSCRKLPPPPPPPRVSSMLRTLKQYANDAKIPKDQEDNITVSSLAMSELSNRTYSKTQPSESSSEINSEYFRTQNERRRRLFLEIDSSRSYPPLSYIGPYDQQTDTATTVSIASSVGFEEEEEENAPRNSNTESGTSRTTTPVSVDTTDAAAIVAPHDSTETERHNCLEERHLSSPLPPPKLNSFCLSPGHRRRRRSKENGECAESATTETPKPKPRNSLHLSTPPTLEEMKEGKQLPTAEPQTNGGGHSTEHSEPKLVSTNRRLTTEDLFIILHNSKKRHNIRTEPAIFSSNRTSPSPCTSPQSPPKHISPIQQPDSPALKRRSWTGNSISLPNNNGVQARTRQSLALDRLGPIRPTTLNDFKRLLAQVRPSPTSPTSPRPFAAGGATSPPLTSSSSTYSALQQVLKSNNSNGSAVVSTSSSGISSSSSISSPLSPTSPMSSTASSMTSPYTSPEHKPQPVLKSNPQSSTTSPPATMNQFIKKFSKSKFLSNNHSDRSRSAVARLVVCPPIPEDEDTLAETTTAATAVSSNHSSQLTTASAAKCTSTWV